MYEWRKSSIDIPVATTDELLFDMTAPVIDGTYLVFDIDSPDTDCASVIVRDGVVEDIADFM